MNARIAMAAQLMRGRDPKSVVLQQIQNNNIKDPIITQLVQYAESGKEEDLIKVAQDYFKRSGLDLNSEFSEFMKAMK